VRIPLLSGFLAIALSVLPDLATARSPAPDIVRRSPVAIQAGDGDYVILLHGMGRRKESMRRLANALHDSSFFTIALDYPALRADVAELATSVVAPAIAEFCTDPSRRIHFVGHSLGNIIARTYLAGEHRPANLGSVVMLAPPNNGSTIIDAIGDNPIVAAILGAAAADLRTGEGSFVSQLPAPDYPAAVIMGNRPAIPFFQKQLPACNDGIVGVEGGRLGGLADFLVIHAPHTTIARYPEVSRQVLAFLKNGVFASGAPALEMETGS
jgi:triacylglycerol lipase